MEGTKSYKSGDISANVDIELCESIIKEYYNFQAACIRKLDGYDDLNFRLVPPVVHRSDNSFVDLWPHGYVFKIINCRESENIDFITEYTNVLLHLNRENISCPLPVKNKNGEYFRYWTDPREKEKVPVRKYIIIMLTYQCGEELRAFKCDERIAFCLGQLMSKLHLHLQTFNYSKAFKRPEFPWSLEAVLGIRDLVNEINVPEEDKILLSLIVDRFETDVLSKLNNLEKGVIHNDLNDGNLLVRKLSDEETTIEFTAVIDFSDMVHTAYLFDISITVCYLCLNNSDNPINLTASLLRGYERRRLTDTEYELLKTCICARLSQSLAIGLHAHCINPDNEYVLDTQKNGWKLLHVFYDMDNEYFVNELRGQIDSAEKS